MTFYTLAVSGADRVRGVHSEFAGRSTADLLHILTLLGVGIAVVFAVLITVNYVQQQGRKKQEARHRAELEEKLSQARHTRMCS